MERGEFGKAFTTGQIDMDYSEPLTRLEKLPSLISDCFRKGDNDAAYQYLEEVKERVSELQAGIRRRSYAVVRREDWAWRWRDEGRN